MKYVAIFFCLFTFSLMAQKPSINKSPQDIKNSVMILQENQEVTAIELPDLQIIPKSIEPLLPSKFQSSVLQFENSVIYSDSTKIILNPGDFKYFVFDSKNKNITQTILKDLSDESYQAIARAPKWIADQLSLKLKELRVAGITTEKQYASLILTAPDKMVDEVAFTIANMSFQSLTDSRFSSDKEAIIRNAEMIYRYADSLKYVKLLEVRDVVTNDYYTTTSYRIYDPIKKDTVWSEIPKEYYYWYIVNPKMDQEGVYVKDNSNDGTGQRTYGFAWRDFIWNNPDPLHNYTNVNKTTSKGSVITIPRFGELIKSAEILWDRNQTYYTFNRPFTNSKMALDIIGNWCSRAIPVDVTMPRAFQPNQILMKHDGMCNEDAFLVAATCRTALIPIIYLGTWSEDHVFGSVWDQDWNHFEFFRGGLAPTGNQFYGITNLLPGGSYGWKNAMVEGFRPDGYALNFTKYYAKTAKLQLKVLDSKGNPVEGALINLFSSPNGPSSGYLKCGTAYSNQYGNAEILLGEGKKYIAQAWHPKLGWAPTDSTRAFSVITVNAVAGTTYNVNLSYETAIVSTLPVTKIGLPEEGNYGINVKFSTQGILTGKNGRESQRSRFYFWDPEQKGLTSIIICDSLNFEKFKKKEAFNALQYLPYVESGDFTFPMADNSQYYVIFSNDFSSSHYQQIKANCSLLSGKFVSVDEMKKSERHLFPNPFSESLQITVENPEAKVQIIDLQGNIIAEISKPFIWTPQDVPQGIYQIVIKDGNEVRTEKAIYIK